MKLKLTESPRDWILFNAALVVALLATAGVLYFRGVINWTTVFIVASVAVSWLAAGVVWPRLLRGTYRVGMRIGHAIGGVVGAVMLGVIFLLVVTPMGWVLRSCGKDLLALRRRSKEGYWHPARHTRRYDRQF